MIDLSAYPLLSGIDTPESFRHFDNEALIALARETRLFLLETLDQTGGHLSSGLGVVELTIALHYVFNTPEDKLIWDVGHQSYPHKLLTGRLQQIHTIRKQGGLSGFPKRDESPYDAFGVGHSSTSISAALGYAIAANLLQQSYKSIAVIGDGAMTAGMAFEALNHAGDLDADLLVILNDNDMSISANVGGLSNYFAKIISGRAYSFMRENSKKVLGVMPSVWEFAKRTEEHMKGMIVPGTLFEELGFNYIGPIDGHDLPTLITTLKNIKQLSGPQFLHVVTRKGNGYAQAEDDPVKYHAVAPGFYKEGGDQKQNQVLTYTQVFSQWLNSRAGVEDKLVAITPAMEEGSGLVEFARQYPKRYFDVGIAEQHAVTLAAGLACNQLRPVVAIYSSFLQRAYDQLIHDVAIQKLPVLFAVDRAGLVGADGATHTGNFDLSYVRCIPNMVIMTPANENECYHMLDYGFDLQLPVVVRYPRGKGCGAAIGPGLAPPLELGKAHVISKAEEVSVDAGQPKLDIAILNFGALLHYCKPLTAKLAARGIRLTLVNMRFVKPLDTELIAQLAVQHQYLFTLEDNVIAGGAGSAVNEVLMQSDTRTGVCNLGLPDAFPAHATQEQLYRQYALDTEGLLQKIVDRLLSLGLLNDR